MLSYPRHVDEIDEAWLSSALRESHPDVTLQSATFDRILWGTATKVFYRVEYNHVGQSRGLPEKICIKGCFDDRIREYLDLSDLFIIEAAFYRDLAPQLDILLPKIVLGSEDGQEGIVILEDLGGSVEFGDPTKAWSPDETLPILESLARLHAHSWGWQAGHLPWLTLGSPGQRIGTPVMMADDRFDALTNRPQVKEFMPRGYRDRDRVLEGLHAMWRRDDQSEHLCACHGDAHVAQTFIDRQGRRGYLDWQTVAIMPWAKDVGYFLSGVMNIADRRAHERDLLEFYLKALEEYGAPRLDRDYAFNEYAIQTLCGIVWPVVTEQQQPIENVITMSERHCAALADLDPLARLGL